nr:hypothetical protein [uncultured Ruegeria sp.]
MTSDTNVYEARTKDAYALTPPLQGVPDVAWTVVCLPAQRPPRAAGVSRKQTQRFGLNVIG